MYMVHIYLHTHIMPGNLYLTVYTKALNRNVIYIYTHTNVISTQTPAKHHLKISNPSNMFLCRNIYIYTYKPQNPKPHPMSRRGFRISVPPLKAGGGRGWHGVEGFLSEVIYVYMYIYLEVHGQL